MGKFSGQHVSSGASNTFVGFASGSVVSTTSNNVGIGEAAYTNGGGSNNIVVGTAAASNYVSTESSNIIIGNAGTASESNVIRIGTQGTSSGQQSTCYIAGIVGVSVSNTELVTINSSTGQLGVTAIGGLLPYTSVNSSASPYTTSSSDVYIGVDCSGGDVTIKLPNAPATGRYYIVKDKTGNAESNNIIITTVGGSVAFDSPILDTYTFNVNYQAAQFIFNGTSYEVF